MKYLLAGILALNSLSASAASAPRKAKRPKSWDNLVAYVLANGADRSLKAPLSRNIGYAEDEVPTKVLRYKRETSPDGREHAIHAVYSKDGEKRSLKNIILTNAKITEKGGKRHIEGYTFRLKPDGTLVSAVHAEGDSGEVIQKKVDANDAALKKALAVEKAVYTKTLAEKDFDE